MTDPQYDEASHVGEALRAARLARGLTLDDVAVALKIRASQLEAIEALDPSALPAPAYASGFVRSYAAFLRQDPAAAWERFRNESSGLAAAPTLNFPEPEREARSGGVGALLAAAAAVALLYGGVQLAQNADAISFERIPEVPARLISLLPGGFSSDEPVETADAGDAPTAADTTTAADAEAAPGADAETTLSAATSGAATPDAVTSDAVTSDAAASDAAASIAAAPVGAAAGRDGTATGAAPLTVSVSSSKEATAGGATAGGAAAVANSATNAAPDADEGGGASRLAWSATPTIADPTGADDSGANDAGAASTATPSSARPAVALDEAPSGVTRAAATMTVAAAEGAAETPSSATTTNADAATTDANANAGADAAADAAPAASSGGVVLTATDDAWVEVRDAKRKIVFTGIMKPGETYAAPAESGLSMMTGNAGGVEVLVDGARLGPLGKRGRVVRNIRLDPSALAKRYGEESNG